MDYNFQPYQQAGGKRAEFSTLVSLDLLGDILIFIHTRLCPKPEGFCLIHHAPGPHNGTPDKQNIVE